MHQHELSEMLPGARGGRALAAARGAEYLRQLGATGGAETAARHGREYMRQIGRAGRAAQLRRQFDPRRILYDGEIVLIISWFPAPGHPRYNRRRRRPILVWIW